MCRCIACTNNNEKVYLQLEPESTGESLVLPGASLGLARTSCHARCLALRRSLHHSPRRCRGWWCRQVLQSRHAGLPQGEPRIRCSDGQLPPCSSGVRKASGCSSRVMGRHRPGCARSGFGSPRRGLGAIVWLHMDVSMMYTVQEVGDADGTYILAGRECIYVYLLWFVLMLMWFYAVQEGPVQEGRGRFLYVGKLSNCRNKRGFCRVQTRAFNSFSLTLGWKPLECLGQDRE